VETEKYNEETGEGREKTQKSKRQMEKGC